MSESLTNINKLVGNMDTSLLVGQLSSMIGKGIDWTETTNSADEEGKPVVSTENLKGVITGVTIADGVSKVVVASGGKNYYVDISEISKVYDLVDETNSEAGVAASTTPLDALQTEMVTAEA